MSIPKLGLGTYRLENEIVKNSVQNALELGYRAIDTAQIYNNEAAIGEALQQDYQTGKIQREDLYLTTKIWIENFNHENVISSLKESLAKLQTDYVDLTLIHWPSMNNEVPLKETLLALMEAKKQGLTREIGISNFTIALMEEAISIVGVENIATNQIELSPYLQNQKVVDFAKQKGIHITSYMTLAYGKALQDPLIHQIAEKHQATAAQVILSWAMALGYSVIPSSTKRENLASNLQATALKLDAEDMKKIATLECNDRLVDPDGLAPQWD